MHCCRDTQTPPFHSTDMYSILLFSLLSGLVCVCVGGVSQSSYTLTSESTADSLLNSDYSSLNRLHLDDDDVKALSLPFVFNFFQDDFTYAYVSSNGLASFSNADTASDYTATHNTDTKYTLNLQSSEWIKTYIVVLHRHLNSNHLASLVDNVRTRHTSTHHAFFQAHISESHTNLRMFTVHSPSEEALRFLRGHEYVLTVHRDRKVFAVDDVRSSNVSSGVVRGPHRTTSDPYSWGLDRIDQSDLPLDEATYFPPAATSGGSGVSVYVVDTGIDTEHVEFGSVAGSEREVANIYNYFGEVTADTDDNGHGTHCAGTVGGVNVGAAPESNIYGVKVLNSEGSGSTAAIVAGLEYILNIRIADQSKSMVVSMSLGGNCNGDCSNDAMVIAVDQLSEWNIPVIVAAGNDADNACLYTPAASETAVTVGATERDDDFASYSCYGSCVDILAPGSAIISSCASSACSGSSSSYSSLSGTSMATPHVAGVTALWLTQTSAYDSTPSPESVKLALQCTSVSDKIHGVPSSTVNLLVQVPPTEYSSIDSAASCEDANQGCELGDNGLVCSGNGDCVFGVCSCFDNFAGETCSLDVPPSWISDSFCCDGEDLSLTDTAPFNTIAFMWTDLDPSRSGNVYYGSVDSDIFAIVFDKINAYGISCECTVELLLHSSGKIEFQYLHNEIGYSCVNNKVSIGIKGPQDSEEYMQYEQVYGPSYNGIPDVRRLTFTPLFTILPSTLFPTPIPSGLSFSSSPSVEPTAELITQWSYLLTLEDTDASLLNGDYNSLKTCTLDDEEVTALTLPFSMSFFGEEYRYAYLSSNGLVSFANAQTTTRIAPESYGEYRPKDKNNTKAHNLAPNENVRLNVHIVVLHRHLNSNHLASLVDNVRTRHTSTHHAFFQAHISESHTNLRMFTVHSPSEEALRFLRGHEYVLTVHRDRKVFAVDDVRSSNVSLGVVRGPHRTTSDPYSWGLDRIDQSDLPLDEATYSPPAATSGGSGVSVYVVDTGIDTEHVEFGSVAGSEREVANIYNYFGEVTADTDDNGHGTHCAGTVGGVNVGAAPESNIYGVKVLNSEGSGSTAAIVAGLEYILNIRIADQSKSMVVSMSLGGNCNGDCSNDAMVIAVDQLSEWNIPVIVAAGNDADNACLYTPAASETAVTVGATERDDDFASYSCYGSCVDILAPGSAIISSCASSACSGSSSSYSSLSGTSMATPHVAGVTALWLTQTSAYDSTPSPESVKLALQCTSVSDKIHGVPSSTVNLLVQVPPTEYSSIDSAASCEDANQGCELGDNGLVCSGNGDCVFGVCSCFDNFAGETCSLDAPPSWISDSFCCDGEDLSLTDTAPFNTIAFMWTDLDPSRSGNVYYGSVDSDIFAIVFDKINAYGISCECTVELLLHSSGKIEFQYLHNEIGYSCGNNKVSIGIKGPQAVQEFMQYEQVYGASYRDIPSFKRLIFDNILSLPPSLSPFPSLSPSLSSSPSVSPSVGIRTQWSYNVLIQYSSESLLNGDYSTLGTISIEDEEVQALQMPFNFNFFNNEYRYAYLSSNGLVSLTETTAFAHNTKNKSRYAPKRNNQQTTDLAPNENVRLNVHIVVLHRHLNSNHLASLVDNVRTRHTSTHHAFFQAHISESHTNLRMFTVHSPSEEALRFLRGHEYVLTVHRDRKVFAVDDVRSSNVSSGVVRGPHRTTSDPYSWGLDRIDQSDLPLDEATYSPPAATSGGSGVSVYVVDTGIDTEHVEFGSVAGSEREVANIYNYFGEVTADTDDNGHGTHCAGTVGGVNVGAAPESNIYGVKVLNSEGSGSTAAIVAGLEYILNIRIADQSKSMVVSMSLGGNCNGDCSNDAMVIAVDQLSEWNIPVIVAAGNDADNACLYTPAASETAVTVGATERDDDFASYSCYGSCVDILAPGSAIISSCASSACSGSSSSYSSLSGTSMATPHVAGVTALWLTQTSAYDSTPSPESVKLALQCTSVSDKIHGVPSSTVNLLVQVPPTEYSSIDSAASCEDANQGCELGDNGLVCSGNGDCVFGVCSCFDNFAGETCSLDAPPSWISDSFCCDGEDLSLTDTAPFNTIAFMWTDLDPSRSGNVYYGSVDSDIFAIVFDKINAYGISCECTVELLLHSSGKIEFQYLHNEIGYSCGNNKVSIGIKGPQDSEEYMQYEQVYGASYRDIPSSGRITFDPYPFPTVSPSLLPPAKVPSFSPSTAPMIKPSVKPTVSPTVVPSLSPSIAPTIKPPVKHTASPTVVPSLSPSIAPTIKPSVKPTASPTVVSSLSPSIAPSIKPSVKPTASPTVVPSLSPTVTPTMKPSVKPTASPTVVPSLSPYIAPTTAIPSTPTTANPTVVPSFSPTVTPTIKPSVKPTACPTVVPSLSPSIAPTIKPSVKPTACPTVVPSLSPTVTPTIKPSVKPTACPTILPYTLIPSSPTSTPTSALTLAPSPKPSISFTQPPSIGSTWKPTTNPSHSPTMVSTFPPTYFPRSPTPKPTKAVPLPPVQTVVTFRTNELVEGVSSTDFDDAAKQAFIHVTANGMDGVSSDDISIASITDTSVTQLRSYASIFNERRLSSAAAIVAYSTTTVMEDFDGKYTDADVMVDDLESQLVVLYSNPNTAQSWVDESVALGSSTVNSSTVVQFSNPDVDEDIEVYVVQTFSPTSTPDKSRKESGGIIDSVAYSTLYIVGALVVLVLVGIVVYCTCVREDREIIDIKISHGTLVYDEL